LAKTHGFFNYLTAYSKQKDYRKLLVSPVNLREKLTSLIERETAHAKAGRPARIIAKLNRLADKQIIESLYEASEAGVSIDLIIRGICMLRPGVPGLSTTFACAASSAGSSNIAASSISPMTAMKKFTWQRRLDVPEPEQPRRGVCPMTIRNCALT